MAKLSSVEQFLKLSSAGEGERTRMLPSEAASLRTIVFLKEDCVADAANNIVSERRRVRPDLRGISQ